VAHEPTKTQRDRVLYLMKHGPPPTGEPRFTSLRQWCIEARIKADSHLAGFLKRSERDPEASMDHGNLAKLARAQGVYMRWFTSGEGPIWIEGERDAAKADPSMDKAIEYQMRRLAWHQRLLDAMTHLDLKVDAPPGTNARELTLFIEKLVKTMKLPGEEEDRHS
jgi:hypothetical protein